MKDLRDVQSPLVVEDTAIFHRESNGAKHLAPAKRRFGATARALLAIAVTLAAVLCGRAEASDTTAPVVTITTPAPDLSGGLTGTAADETGGSGLSSFTTLRLWRYSGSTFQFWNGTAWTTTVANLAATVPVAPSTSWSVTTALPSGTQLPPSQYGLQVAIKDIAGNISPTNAIYFKAGNDETAPSSVIHTPAAGSNVTSISTISSTSTNVASPSGHDTSEIRFLSTALRKRVGTTSTYLCWDFVNHAWVASWGLQYFLTEPTDSNWSVSANLPSGADLPLGEYYVNQYCTDYSNNISNTSNYFSVVAPPAPTGLTATARGLVADLAWTAPVYPAGTTGAITSYRVERQTSGGSWSTLTTTTARTYTNTGLTSGTTYGYRVVALDGLNESAASGTATITPVTDITAPVFTISAPVANSHVASLSGISGTATDEAGGTGVAGYNQMTLTREAGSSPLYWNGTTWTTTVFNMAATVPVAPATDWHVTTPMPTGANLPISRYIVAVVARDAANNTRTVVSSIFYVGTDTTPPVSTTTTPANASNVTSLSQIDGTVINAASPTGEDTSDLWRVQVSLRRVVSTSPTTYIFWDFAAHSWSTVATGGTAVTDYPSSPTDETWSVSGNLPSGANLPLGDYLITKFSYDVTYNMSVGAQGSTTFHVVAPPALTSLTATPAAGAVNLAWTAPVYPAGTTGSITSYRIERQAGAGAWSTLATTTGTTYTDSTVTAGTAYTYRAYALDGTNESAASNTATATSAALTVSLASTVTEGATLIGTVARNTPTAAALTVSLLSSNTAAATVPATVTISAGQTSAEFTLTAVDDHVLRATQNVTITASATGFVSGTDAVSVTDNDVAGVTVTPVTGLTTTEAPGAGHTATFTVCLTTQPTGDVTIALSSSDAAEGTVLPATLTFTSGNWDETQLVTVTGVPDGIVDGDQPYTVVTAATSTDTSYDGVDVPDVAVTNLDMDIAALTLALGPTVAEGETLTGTVSRNTPTTADLVVTLASDDTTEATVPATVTILAGHADATFTLTGVDDGLTDGAHDAVITASATSHAAATDTVTVTDISTGAVDALIRKQGDPAFLGNGVVNATAVGQTAAQNAAGNVTGSYDVRVFNRQTAAHTLTLKASASTGGGAWTITYYDGANDITATITSAEGWSTADPIDPAASTTIRIDVKPAITVEADTVKTVTLTATTAGDAEASDTIAAVTTKTGLAPPTLSAAGGDSQVLVEWTPVVGATAYTLSRGPASFGPWTALPDTSATTYLDDAVTNGTTYYYHVIATVAAVAGDASNVASATPHVVPHPDLSIRLKQPEGEEESYLGNGVYNLTGAGQTRNELTYGGKKLIYEVKLTNNGGQTEPYSLKVADATDGWTVKFYDGLEETTGKEVTAQVKAASGWEVTLPTGSDNARALLITVTAATAGTVTPSKEVLLTAAPKAGASTASNSDAVKAGADLQSVARIDWSSDGDTWHHATGPDAVAVPLTLFDSTVNFRAIKSNPDLGWPDITGALPSWQNGDDSVGGETVTLGFHTVPTATISATCGNTLSVSVPVRPAIDVSLSGSTEVMPTDSSLASTRQATLTAALVDSGNVPAANIKVRFMAKYDDGTTAGEFGAAGTADDTITTGADGKANITWTGGTPSGQVTFTAEALDVNNDPTGQKDTWLVLLRKSHVRISAGNWSQDNTGAWSRSVTATAYLSSLKVSGRAVTLVPIVLTNGELVTGNVAPLDSTTGTTNSEGEFTTVQRWNPDLAGNWPSDYTVEVNAISAD